MQPICKIKGNTQFYKKNYCTFAANLKTDVENVFPCSNSKGSAFANNSLHVKITIRNFRDNTVDV